MNYNYEEVLNELLDHREIFLTQLRPHGNLNLVAIKPQASKDVSQLHAIVGETFPMPGEIDRAHAFIERHNLDKNIYFTLNPVKGLVVTKAQKKDISYVEYIAADIDPLNLADDYQTGRSKIEAMLDKLKNTTTFTPAFVIDSGNGAQPIYRLSAPVGIKEGEQLGKAVMRSFNGDACWSADHLFRMPGTLNHPDYRKLAKGYPSEPQQATLLRTTDIVYTPDAIREICQYEEPIVGARVDLSQHADAGYPGTDEELLGKARAKNKFKFIDLFDSGKWEGKGISRSEADASLASMLSFWCGADPDRIARIMRLSKLVRPKWDRDKYLSTTINKAIQFQAKGGGFYTGQIDGDEGSQPRDYNTALIDILSALTDYSPNDTDKLPKDVEDEIIKIAASCSPNPSEVARIVGEIKSQCKLSITPTDLKAAIKSVVSRAAKDADHVADILAKEFKDRYSEQFLLSAGEVFWEYDKTHWKHVPNVQVGKILNGIARTLGHPLAGNVTEAIVCLKRDLSSKDDPLGLESEQKAVINCLNGELWLDGDTPVLKPHSKDSGLTTCTTVEYDPDAECPLFDTALEKIMRVDDEMMPGHQWLKDNKYAMPHEEDYDCDIAIEHRTWLTADRMRHVLEEMGYAIQPNKFLKAFVIWLNSGDGGKTSLAKAMVNLVGMEGVYSMPINEIESPSQIASLCNKNVLIDDDVDVGVTIKGGMLKKLSENNPISAAYKYGHQFNFNCHVLPFLLCNREPRINDVTRGMETRAQVVPFYQQFRRKEECVEGYEYRQDPDLWDRIFAEELPGVMNRLIAGFYRVRSRGAFNNPVDCVEAKNRWLGDSDHLSAFVSETFEQVDKGSVPIAKIKEAYKLWCQNKGLSLHAISDRELAKNIESMGYQRSRSNGMHVLQGVTLITPAAPVVEAIQVEQEYDFL